MVDIDELERRKDVGGLIDAFRGSNRSVYRWDVAEALGRCGETAVEPLIIALKGEDDLIRADAAEALGKCGDKRAVDPLVTALGDRHVHVRFAAALALGKFGDERAVEPLIILTFGELK